MAENRLDRLTSQLSELPSIIGRLGISVATAQKALNADYVSTVQEIMQIVNQTVSLRNEAWKRQIDGAEAEVTAAETVPAGETEDAKKLRLEKLTAAKKKLADLKELPQEVWGLIQALAPSRYQFSETKLDFSADLSQTLNVGGGLSLGVGMAAVTVNASFSLAYGFDYRAAARISTVLHALPADPAVMPQLLKRAAEIDANKLTLQPKDTNYSQHMIDGLKEIALAIKPSTPSA
jgi:hypothetical protein